MAEVGKMNRAKRPAATAGAAARRKKRRRGSPALYYILIILALLAGGIALSLTVFFKIESVTVTGTDKYLPQEIIAESGIITGENLFRINSQAIKTKLLAKFPYMESVTVHLKLPGEIQLLTTQCTPACALSQDDEYLLITRDGKVLERGLIFIPEDVPIIKGVNAGSARPGEWLRMGGEEEAEAQRRVKQITALLSKQPDAKDESAEETRALLEEEKDALERGIQRSQSMSEALRMLDYLFDAIEKTSFGEVTNVDLTDEYNMKIVYENRLLLNLGVESELVSKLDFLKEMIKNRLPPDAQGLIDASNINRYVNYVDMPLSDAEKGKKHNSNPAAATINPKADEPESEADKSKSEADEPKDEQ